MLITANNTHSLARGGRVIPVRRALGALLLAVAASTVAQAATLALGSANATPGGDPVVLPLVLTPTASQRVASLQFDLVFDAAKLTAAGIQEGPTAIDADKSIVFNQLGPGNYRIIIAGFNNNQIAAGTVAEISFAVAAGVVLTVPVGLENVLLASTTGSQVPVVVTNGSIDTGLTGRTHSADTNADYEISLGEILRPIQFYNSAQFHCKEGTEDGYAPGPGEQDCTTYDSDYNPENWRVDFPEILRLVQFYNSGGYQEDPTGEDGFAPGP